MTAGTRVSWGARLSVVLAIGLVALALADALRLRDQQATNARIRAAQPQRLVENDALEVVHAEALRQGALGNRRVAHDLYARVALNAGADLGARAEYNHANLLLQEAIELRQSEGDARALPIVELAKEAYRKVLREAPALDARTWDARYNLERALRFAPDPPDGEGEGTMPQERERAPTTMRGETLGLP
jgi:mxaK protein